MKRLTTVLTAVGLAASVNAFAGGIDEIAVITPEITIPKLPGGFFIGGSGDYLQVSATASDLDYASINQTPLTVGEFTEDSSSVGHLTPDYTWGWSVLLGYTFDGTGNDIIVDYFHFQGSKSNARSVAAPGNITPAVIAVDEGTITAAEGNVTYYTDQVDLMVGQFIDIGSRLRVHPGVGLRWAAVHRDVTGSFISPVVPNPDIPEIRLVTLSTNTNSHFSGLGPILGLDASYDLWYGFAGVAHFDAAILAGKVHSELHFTDDVYATTTFEQRFYAANFYEQSVRRMVPVVDGKLGVNYMYAFSHDPKMSLTAEVGWAFTNYFNVADGLGGNVTTTPANIAGHGTVNVGAQGLYFDLVLAM